MKFQKSIVTVFILIALSCGNQKPDEIFSRDGASFTYPSDWSISKEDDVYGGGYYVSMEKEGFGASGTLKLTMIKGRLDSSRYFEILQEEYEEIKMFDDLEFESARDTVFNGIPATSTDFKYNTSGIKHSGVAYVFYNGENMYSVIKEEADKDISENKADGFGECSEHNIYLYTRFFLKDDFNFHVYTLRS